MSGKVPNALERMKSTAKKKQEEDNMICSSPCQWGSYLTTAPHRAVGRGRKVAACLLQRRGYPPKILILQIVDIGVLHPTRNLPKLYEDLVGGHLTGKYGTDGATVR